MQQQVRLVGNFGLNGGIPWPRETDGATCYICKEALEDDAHFFLDSTFLDPYITNLQESYFLKSARYVNFLSNLDRNNEILLFLDIWRYISCAVGKAGEVRAKNCMNWKPPG